MPGSASATLAEREFSLPSPHLHQSIDSIEDNGLGDRRTVTPVRQTNRNHGMSSIDCRATRQRDFAHLLDQSSR